MLSNALLLRWIGGWSERTDTASISANGRKESVLSLGACQSQAEAYRIADEQLALYASTLTQTTAEIEPVSDADTPYLAFAVGDTITVPNSAGTPTAERVMAITVAEDVNGQVTYAPELNDLILESQERFIERLRKLSIGTSGMG